MSPKKTAQQMTQDKKALKAAKRADKAKNQGEAANDTCAEKAVTGVEGDTNAETGVEGVTITGIDVEEGKIAENNNQPK
ncbi:hypothetical protein MMC09_005531 [Bachmanniomyces sp. S44760]|nr:hypothetical protein [Bachmanniomyces sp. S44760]